MDNGFVPPPKEDETGKKRVTTPRLPDTFQAFRPGWGESDPIGPDHYMLPLPGLPTMVPGRINLGPRADSLSKVPYQFSSADHWRHMSEAGYFAKKWWIG